MTRGDDPPRLGPPKSKLQAMLAEAVRNTGGTPVDHPSNDAAKSDKATEAAPRQWKDNATIMPTADQVAAAIVAAAQECDEDPVRIFAGRSTLHMRSRHYAMHALFHCFPGLPRATYATLVGCPGLPKKFYDNSKCNVIALLPGPGGRRRAQWWSESTYANVIAAIEAVK